MNFNALLKNFSWVNKKYNFYIYFTSLYKFWEDVYKQIQYNLSAIVALENKLDIKMLNLIKNFRATLNISGE